MKYHEMDLTHLEMDEKNTGKYHENSGSIRLSDTKSWRDGSWPRSSHVKVSQNSWLIYTGKSYENRDELGAQRPSF